MAPIDLTGKWEQTGAENIENYLKELGIGLPQRKIGASQMLKQEVKQDGDKFYIKMEGKKTMEVNFVIGTPMETTLPTGEDVVACAEWKENKLVVVAKPKDETKHKPQTISRYMEGEQMIMKMEVGDVVASRTFKKV